MASHPYPVEGSSPSRPSYLAYLRRQTRSANSMPRTGRPSPPAHSPRDARTGGVVAGRGSTPDARPAKKMRGTRGASTEEGTSASASRDLAAPSRSKRSNPPAHPLESEGALVMSKSKSSAATVAGHERGRVNAPLHPVATAKSARGAHGKRDKREDREPQPVDARRDDDFERDAPAVGPGAQSGDIELIEDEFDLETAPAEGGAERGSTLSPRKAPTDKEIEEGGGDSMLARYFREMATHPVMGPEEELQTAIGVEDAEVEQWAAILSYHAAGDSALDALEKDLPTGDEALALPQLEELRKALRTFTKATNRPGAGERQEVPRPLRLAREGDPPRRQRPPVDRAGRRGGATARRGARRGAARGRPRRG